MKEQHTFDVLYHEIDPETGLRVWWVITTGSVHSRIAMGNVKKMLNTVERGRSVKLFPMVSQVGQPGQFDFLIGKPLRFSVKA